MVGSRRAKVVTAAVAVLVLAAVLVAVGRATGGGGTASHKWQPAVIATTTRTNVVVILTDDQRWDTLWAMPNVQRLLVKHGVTFENSFVSDALCCPSRASILTGNYAHTTGVYDNHPPYGGAPKFHERGDDRSTIATWLHAAGYDTGLFGKYLNSYEGGVPPGWDRWVAFDYEPQYYPYFVFTNEPGACARKPACRLPHKVAKYSTTYFGGAATRFIRTAPAGRPVFVYYAPFAPHAPSFPQPRYATRFANLPQWRPPSYDEADVSDKPPWIRSLPRLDGVASAQIQANRQAEYQSLLTVDDEVGAIVRALRDSHRLAHSVILFASDNGVTWGEHRLTAGAKQLPYDEMIRVPLVVRDEPATTRPRTDHHLVANIDWAATLADAAGVKHPRTDGRSFLPFIDGHADAPWRSHFLLEHLNGTPPSLAPSYCGIRSTRYTYVRYAGGADELYDLKHDPYELRNLASDPADAGVVAQMQSLLRRECNPPPPGYQP
jgi:arylsulfatase A-like enzyme